MFKINKPFNLPLGEGIGILCSLPRWSSYIRHDLPWNICVCIWDARKLKVHLYACCALKRGEILWARSCLRLVRLCEPYVRVSHSFLQPANYIYFIYYIVDTVFRAGSLTGRVGDWHLGGSPVRVPIYAILYGYCVLRALSTPKSQILDK